MISIDPQINGTRDDGTEGGVSRVEVVRSQLVPVPFRRGMFTPSVSGSASASLSSLFPENDDGTQTGIFVSVAASATLANSAVVSFWVMGSIVGLRLSKFGSYAAANPVGCKIDGVAYPVNVSKGLEPVSQAAAAGGIVPGLISEILTTDLGDGPHFVELTFPAFLSGTTRQYGVLGYVADARAGYALMPRGVLPLPTVTALTTSFASLIVVGTALYGIRKVFFQNTTAGALTVNVRYGSGTPFWSRPVPANDTIEFDPGGVIYDALQASASAIGVNAQVMGAI